jgi:hypothetical protein
MRGSLVTLCVGIAVGLLTSCESTKSPKNDRPPAEPAKVAPIAPTAKVEKPKADEPRPAIVDVPTAPLAMEKLEGAEGDEADQADAVSLTDAFPERRLPGEKLSDKMIKRIRYKLRDVTKAPIALRHFIQVPNPDGSLEVFAIYEYGELESCLRGYATRKEGREPCRRQVSSTECVKLGAVRSHFGAPKAGASMDTSGTLTVWSMAFENTNCSSDKEIAFVDDVDRDGKLEMLIDLTTSYTAGGDRSPYEHGYLRTLYVFPGAEGSEPFDLNVDSTVGSYGAFPPEFLGSDVAMGDFNRDGHMDFLHDLGPQCPELDDEFADRGEEWDAKEEACKRKPRPQAVYLYDLKSDQWEESTELSEAMTAAVAKAAEAEAAEAAEEATAAEKAEKSDQSDKAGKSDKAASEQAMPAAAPATKAAPAAAAPATKAAPAAAAPAAPTTPATAPAAPKAEAGAAKAQ